MTRPNIIRADTIDLQDHNAPSAQDHSRKPDAAPLGVGPAAPHQAAELRQVQTERQAEEDHLAQAWTNGKVLLSEDPPSDDEATTLVDGVQNGLHGDQIEEDEDDMMDDDLMDKISSSPSIDDGVYPSGVLPRSHFPTRSSSLGWSPRRPATPSPVKQMRNSQDSSNSLTADDTSATEPHGGQTDNSDADVPGSSPLVSGNVTDRSGTPQPPFAGESDTSSSSPFTVSPAHYPLTLDCVPLSFAQDHHRMCEYNAQGVSLSPIREQDGEQDHELEPDPPLNSLINSKECESLQDRDGAKINDEIRVSHTLVGSATSSEKSFPRTPLATPLLRSESDILISQELIPDDDSLIDDDDSDWESDDSDESDEQDRINQRWELANIWYADDHGSDTSDNGSFDTAPSHMDDDLKQFPVDPRYIDSGWGGECLRETEDIDFEFVYALHTFVATVDGQANATKGDTMVLLDDSNSYWWLVRVVKDSTIGYLPAEHIETPTERLARLNKHRNIDLAATMLGDTTEKSKNPLKKAMRRRNAKTVTFGALNYVEASDYDYSSDEDESRDSSDMLGDGISEEANGGAVQEPEDTKETTIAPLSVAAVKSNMQDSAEDGDDEDRVGRRRNVEGARPSSEALSDQQERPRKSKDGTVRDSFFKDDTVETRKISLTPNLLKDDSQQQPRRDMKGTFDSIDKEIAKSKEDKKKKEKKPGMLSGLFKKKDKKAKGETGSETATIASEISRGSPTSDESTTDLQAANISRKSSVGKLQKVQPAGVAAEATQQTNSARPLGAVAETTPAIDVKENTARSVSPEKTSQSSLSQKPSLRVKTAEKTNDVLHGIGNRMRSNSDAVKREKVKTAKTREALDVGSSPEDEVDDPFADPENEAVHTHDRLSESPVHITAADAVHDSEPPALVGDSSSHTSSDELTSLRSSPSPINEDVGTRDFASQSHLGQSPPSPVSPLSTHSVLPVSTHTTGLKQAAATGAHIPPAPTREPPPQPSTLQTDLSQHMVSSSSNIPARNASTSTTASTTPSSYAPTWSDTSLRHYLDSTSHDEVRDLLIIVNDTSNVEPVGMDHEYMKDLFVDERRGLKDLDAELDRLLGGWLDRRRGAKPGSIVTPVMASVPSMGQAVSLTTGAPKTAISPISPVSAAVSPISPAGSETRTRVMPPVPKTKAKPVVKPVEVTMDAGDF